jgi:N-acetylneuraminic acid mutarotase
VQLKGELVDMMGESFKQRRLDAIFTFRIVELVKRIKIEPTPSLRGLPWGLSLATGILITLFSININLTSTDRLMYFHNLPLADSSIQKVGEYPVDIAKVSETSVISEQQGSDNGLGTIVPNAQNALFMAPQAEGGTWTRKADMPTARECASASEANGKIYLIGGSFRNANGWLENMNIVEEYNPITDKWTRKSAIPTARSVFSTSVVDGKIYAIGGSTAFGTSSIVEEYDPVLDKWTKKANMPTVRAGLSTCAVNGKIYAIGGSRWDNVNAKLDVFSTVEEYDPKTDKWTAKADMPTKRSFFTSSASAADGLIYVVGGGDEENKGNMLSLVEQYDPVADKWERKADMPTARVTCTAMVNGKIYAIGGYLGKNRGILSIVEEYDPVSDSWTRKNDMPTAKTNLSVCAVNGKIYAMGGNTDVQKEILVSIVEEYDPQTESKSIDFKGKLPTTWGDTKLAQNK